MKPHKVRIAREAIKVMGGVTATHKRTGAGIEAIKKWRVNGIPAGYAVTVSTLTGIPAHELRPDIFPDPLAGLRRAG